MPVAELAIATEAKASAAARIRRLTNGVVLHETLQATRSLRDGAAVLRAVGVQRANGFTFDDSCDADRRDSR